MDFEDEVTQDMFALSVSPEKQCTDVSITSQNGADGRKRRRSSNRDHNQDTNSANTKAKKDAENLFKLSISPGFKT